MSNIRSVKVRPYRGYWRFSHILGICVTGVFFGAFKGDSGSPTMYEYSGGLLCTIPTLSMCGNYGLSTSIFHSK